MASKSKNGFYSEPHLQLNHNCPSSIRILDLLPGPKNGKIKTRLRVVSLNTHPRPYYEALSYTWGQDPPTAPVTINEAHQLLITPNAFAALQSLRFRRKIRTIWIDSICINQENKSEKDIQVPLMGDVYRYAAVVNVWLGRTSMNPDPGIRMGSLFDSRLWSKAWRAVYKDVTAKTIGPDDAINAPTTRRLACKEAISSARSERDFIRHYLHGRHLALAAAIEENSPWHERLWIVQEYLLAKRLQFGFGFHWIECDIALLLDWAKTKSEATDSFKQAMGFKFAATRLSLHGMSGLNYTCLGALQNLFRTQKCYKPQDMVYGMLGLIDPYQATLIPVNYNLDPYKVFAQATYSAIRSETTFQVLDMVDLIARRDEDSGLQSKSGTWKERHGETSKLLPSWAIDFANFPERGQWQQGSWGDVELTRRRHKLEKSCSLSDDCSQLRIKAVPFDTIATHFPVQLPGEATGLEEKEVVWGLFLNVVIPTLYAVLKARQLVIASGDYHPDVSLPAASLLTPHITADQVRELLDDDERLSRRLNACSSIATKPAANLTMTVLGDGGEEQVMYYQLTGPNIIKPEQDATVNVIKTACLLWATICDTPFDMQCEGKVKVDADDAEAFLQPCTRLRDNATATSGGVAFFGTLSGGLVGIAPLGVKMDDLIVQAPDEESLLVLRKRDLDPERGDVVTWQFVGRALIFSLHTLQSWNRDELEGKMSLDEAPIFVIS
ncbi:hypothetical protein FSST1_010223 [Fusarium sambucinum]